MAMEAFGGGLDLCSLTADILRLANIERVLRLGCNHRPQQ